MKLNSLLLSATVVMLFGSLVFGSNVFFPANQIEKGKCLFAFYYQNYNEKLDFGVSQESQIQVGNTGYPSSSRTDFEGNGKGNGVCAQLMCNPNNGLYYWLKAGLVGYELEIPSSSVKNKLTSLDHGWVIGAGISSS